MMESMVFYESFLESVEDFDESDQWTLVKAILRYGLRGVEPNLPKHLKGIFKVARPLIDANIVRRENGKKGGRPKKPMVSELKTNGFEEENHTYENLKPNVNVNGYVNDNAYVNDDDDKKEKRKKSIIDDAERKRLEERDRILEEDDYAARHEDDGKRYFEPVVKLGRKKPSGENLTSTGHEPLTEEQKAYWTKRAADFRASHKGG